jgi:hypothetical protein
MSELEQQLRRTARVARVARTNWLVTLYNNAADRIAELEAKVLGLNVAREELSASFAQLKCEFYVCNSCGHEWDCKTFDVFNSGPVMGYLNDLKADAIMNAVDSFLDWEVGLAYDMRVVLVDYASKLRKQAGDL